jgi:hypothetical protein
LVDPSDDVAVVDRLASVTRHASGPAADVGTGWRPVVHQWVATLADLLGSMSVTGWGTGNTSGRTR